MIRISKRAKTRFKASLEALVTEGWVATVSEALDVTVMSKRQRRLVKELRLRGRS